jgi:hypothetical protein
MGPVQDHRPRAAKVLNPQTPLHDTTRNPGARASTRGCVR